MIVLVGWRECVNLNSLNSTRTLSPNVIIPSIRFGGMRWAYVKISKRQNIHRERNATKTNYRFARTNANKNRPPRSPTGAQKRDRAIFRSPSPPLFTARAPRQKCRLLRCACTTSILRIHPTRRRRYTCIQFAFRYACSRFMFVINLFARVLWCSRFGGGTGLKSGRMEGGSPSTKGGVGLGRRSQLYKDVVNNYANMNCIHFSDALRIIKKIRRRNITLKDI